MISWTSKKQNTYVLFSADVEYCVIEVTFKELAWLVFLGLGFNWVVGVQASFFFTLGPLI